MADIPIHGIGGPGAVSPAGPSPAPAPERPERSFGETLRTALDSVAEDQSRAHQLVESYMAGESTDLHTVMIELEKADLSFRAMMEVRNKLLEAYREVMRMPM